MIYIMIFAKKKNRNRYFCFILKIIKGKLKRYFRILKLRGSIAYNKIDLNKKKSKIIKKKLKCIMISLMSCLQMNSNKCN